MKIFLKSFLSIAIFVLFFLSNIELNAQHTRKVVFEEFTEVWCGPCAGLAPRLSAWLDNHPDIIPIMYTSYFVVNGSNQKVDEMGYIARRNLYSVPFYPYARLNGDALAPNDDYPGYPTDTSAMNTVIDTMTKEIPVSIEIDFINNGNQGTVNVNILSSVDINNKLLTIMITEKHHTYEKQPNGMTEYHDIFRKTLNNENGDIINLKANEIEKFSYDYELSDDINYELNAIAILQSTTSKFILQSEKVFSVPTSVNNNYESELKIYPNPIYESFSVNTYSVNENIEKFIIYDLIGNKIISNIVNGKANKINISSEGINSGIYILNVITNKRTYFEKIIIQ